MLPITSAPAGRFSYYMTTGQKSIRDLSYEVKLRALSRKRTSGTFEAIRFLTVEHKVGLLEAKQYIEGHDEFGKEIHRSWINTGNNIFVVVFTGVGILLLTIAGIVYSYQYNIKSKAILTNAIVKELRPYGNAYAVVFGYYDDDVYIESESGSVSTSPGFDVGEKVQIWISDNDPYNILMINSFINRWLAIIILSSIGFLFCLFGLLIYKIF